jgi:hypothetical protein
MTRGEAHPFLPVMLFLSTIKKGEDYMHKSSLSRKIMNDDYKGKVLHEYNEVVTI